MSAILDAISGLIIDVAGILYRLVAMLRHGRPRDGDIY